MALTEGNIAAALAEDLGREICNVCNAFIRGHADMLVTLKNGSVPLILYTALMNQVSLVAQREAHSSHKVWEFRASLTEMLDVIVKTCMKEVEKNNKGGGDAAK